MLTISCYHRILRIRIDEGDEIAAISQIEETEEDIVVEGVEGIEGIEGAETTTPDTDTQASSSDDAATDVQGESDNTITN